MGEQAPQRRKGVRSKHKLPCWVRRDGERLFLDPGAAQIVRRIFSMAIAGHGALGIAKTLNAEKVPILGRKVLRDRPVNWSAPTVRGILTTRTAVGEYQSHKWTTRADKPA